MPTLLTEKTHLPKYPNLDFSFFKFCKKRDIKIGLFYRDIYWKFEDYKKQVSIFKRLVTIPLYYYDLFNYKKYLTKLYVPNLKMYSYFKEITFDSIIDELPPGADNNYELLEKRILGMHKKDYLTILYVGGLGNQYQIKELFKAVNLLPFIKLVVCCSKLQWEKEKNIYTKYLNNNIKIVHCHGEKLEDLYNIADICSMYFKPDKYREFAVPYKTFEYLSHAVPIIASKGLGIEKFVENNKIGWVVPYDYKELINLLTEIFYQQELLNEKVSNCLNVLQGNNWSDRALKVINDLT